MSFVILAYRSRNQTVRMYEVFRANGIICRIINTPREANVGCGISVRFEESDLPLATSIAYSTNTGSMVGFFRVRTNSRGGYSCSRI